MIFKRTLILNDINNKSSARKGVLNLEDANNQLIGSLRLYNVSDYEVSHVALGLNVNNEVLKIPVQFKDGVCNFKTTQSLDLQDRLSCALVDVSDISNPHIIVGGTSTYLQEWATKVEQAFFVDELPLNKEEMYSLGTDNEIQQTITQTLKDDQQYHDCSQCSKCKYREAFYHDTQPQCQSIKSGEDSATTSSDNANLQPNQQSTTFDDNSQLDKVDVLNNQSNPNILDSKHPTIEPEKSNIVETSQEDNSPQGQFINLKTDETPEEGNFYEQVKDQINELFEQYEVEQQLQELIPNSKWVRVKYEDSQNFYVLGIIYEDGEIKYISYGLPAQNPSKPPKDLKEYAQWLPVDANNPEGEGYWLVYQSAQSGESILVEVI